MRKFLFIAFVCFTTTPLFAGVINLQHDNLHLSSEATLESSEGVFEYLSESYSGHLLGNATLVNTIDAHLRVEALEDEVYSVQSLASAEDLGSSSFALVADTEVYLSGSAEEGSLYDVSSLNAQSTVDWLFSVADGDVEFDVYMLETPAGYLSLYDHTLDSLVLEVNSFGFTHEEFTLLDGHQYAMYIEGQDSTFDDANMEINFSFDGEIVDVPEPAGLVLFIMGMFGILGIRLLKGRKIKR